LSLALSLMQRLIHILFFGFYFSLFTFNSKAQTTVYKIAVFAPLYIDSAFDGNNYKLGNNNLPKAMLPGLEFYNGVMMAVDSLRAEGYSFEINIYDTKSSTAKIGSILLKDEMKNVGLIIASFTNRSELKTLTDYAAINNIPLVSATYPNDGGISPIILISFSLIHLCVRIVKSCISMFSVTMQPAT